jgi:hypothetical protein
MGFTSLGIVPRSLTCWFCMAVMLAGCDGSHDETVGGLQVPIPGGMTKSEEKGVELSIPGFGGAQASYRGKLEPNQVVDFYKKEMPARGWKPSIGVLSQGGMLTYAKEGKSLIVMVGKSNGDTNMTITAGEAKR